MDLEQFEADLWGAADNLRANSKLTSSDYFMPVLGVIFLRHAANRFDAATRQIAEDQAAGRRPKRKVQPANHIRRRARWLPEVARYNSIMDKDHVLIREDSEREVILLRDLRAGLKRLNSGLPGPALEQAVERLTRVDFARSLLQHTREF